MPDELKDKFKIVLSELLESKIRIYCSLSKSREWSGVLFYKFEGTFEDGLTIFANDMFLMNQGSGAHTEFDLNEPDATRYMVFNGLTDHCIGLIHSHNKMQAFFSGEDMDTLGEYGNGMNNFVSLIVNNDGAYVARVTRKMVLNATETTVVAGICSYQHFNTGEARETPYEHTTQRAVQGTQIQFVNLNIEKPVSTFNLEAIERFGELSEREARPAYGGYGGYGGYQGYGRQEFQWPYGKPAGQYTPPSGPIEPKEPEKEEEIKPQVVVQEAVAGTLFPENPIDFEKEELLDYVGDDELLLVNSLKWNKHKFNVWFAQLVSSSPFVTSPTVNMNLMENEYKKAFKTYKEFDFWFESWLDYMLESYNKDWIKVEKTSNPDDIILIKLYMELNSYKTRYSDRMRYLIKKRML